MVMNKGFFGRSIEELQRFSKLGERQLYRETLHCILANMSSHSNQGRRGASADGSLYPRELPRSRIYSNMQGHVRC